MSTAEDYAEEILHGPAGPQIGAFLDFDGTLIDGFSVNEFVLNRLRHRELMPRDLVRGVLGTSPLGAYRLARAGIGKETCDRDLRAVYEFALALLSGRTETELLQFGRRVLWEGLAGKLRKDAWTLVQAHQRMGHSVVLLSAATRYQVAPLADHLGIEHVLCSPLETLDGRLTGRLGGPPLRGPVKAQAVDAFAAEHGIELTLSHAYADSLDDIPFLETAGRSCVVNPGKELSRAAAEHGWHVLHMDGRPVPSPITFARSVAAGGGMLTGVGTGLGTVLVGADRRRAAELGLRFGSDLCLGLAGVRLRVTGEENLWLHRPAVFLVNHQSPLDAPIVSRLLERGYTGFAKKEARRFPVLAQAAEFLEMVFVDRGSAARTPEVIDSAVRRLAAGLSLAIAPEGSRSLTPSPGPFKKGAFLVAKRAGVPVVPIVIRNSGQLMWRNAKTIRPGVVEVVVHDPIDVGSWKVRDFGRKVEEVRRLYIDTLSRWQEIPAPDEADPAAGEPAPAMAAESGEE
ncbi:HAD-IB family hydrolase [Actinomadura rubrisoli]|uniref:HAD-IB family hydrolase n=1 Tax=Actinomadura rubrisoli TaxID=2530368 RepID=A0A4R5CL21_9ACTN|nr:HAD-IB family hydrolase [Actinomadura rubrisoli]TDD98144.1 HAD-IB family hydrolase [Actinomadura rubrisoli]